MSWQLNSVLFLTVIFGSLGIQSISIAQSVHHFDVKPKAKDAPTKEQIDLAAKQLRRAESQWRTASELAERGTISQAMLEEAELHRNIAKLEWKLLRFPETKKQVLVQIAKQRLRYAEKNHNRNKGLYNSGSLSQLRFRRSSVELKNAKIDWRVATGEISREAAKLLKADKQVELAKIEFKLAQLLYDKRSITKSSFQRMEDRLQEAQKHQRKLKEELERRKKEVDQRIRT